ncbi:hypothetical protein B296_00013437 [Ensete ventricosum]|uniref:Uncharacterized protein n=1 Tax=Ensete ventricosum TaxID=4639 RepID=A0A427B2I8_ENSVE|nr:hypothetical protein B296_00013437 [Ensete ventricosum]
METMGDILHHPGHTLHTDILPCPTHAHLMSHMLHTDILPHPAHILRMAILIRDIHLMVIHLRDIYLPLSLVHRLRHIMLLAGGAAAAAAAYGAYQSTHGHHQMGHGMPHGFGHHGKFKHGMFGGKHGRFGGKFRKWK